MLTVSFVDLQAVSINCSHSFCSYCLEKWMVVKRQCPVCRAPVISTVPVIALDSYISRMVDETFSEDMKSRRQAVIKERQGLCSFHSGISTAILILIKHKCETVTEEFLNIWIRRNLDRWICLL